MINVRSLRSVYISLLVVCALSFFSATGLFAQPTLTVLDWIPAGLNLTQGPSETLQYQIGGTTNIVEVTWVRDDGAVLSVANVDPTSSQPFIIDLPLPSGVDRVTVSWIGTVRDTLTNQVAGGDRAATIVVDDVGPDIPNITSPPLPHTDYSPTFPVNGNVLNNPPAGGNTDIPETGGSVVFYDPVTSLVLGGGIIQADAAFLATVDLSSLAADVVHNLSVHAVDSAGNIGTTGTIQLGYTNPPPPALTNLVMTPPGGTLTNAPGVLVSGTVSGLPGPFTVNIYVNSFIQSQIAGLSNGESFNHTLTLPGEGAHNISVQAVNSNVPPDFSIATNLGTITLDRTPPGAPLITEPFPGQSPYITNASSLTIVGLSQERDTNTTDTKTPAMLFTGPSGIAFSPVSPVPIDSSGRFETEADISALSDGTYTITVATRDEAGNSGPESQTHIVFVKDTTSPMVEEVRVDDVVAPQSSPEIYVGQRSVRVSVRVNEDMPVMPTASVGQNGYTTQPMGVSSNTLRVFNYVAGVIPGYDGPVLFNVTGGLDVAGNSLDSSYSRLFIVDTVPPEVVAVEPTDGTSVSISPDNIRVRFNDPLSSAGTASGIDTLACQIAVQGPVGGSNAVIAGTLVPYDPLTVDFIPTVPLTQDGTYRVTITAVDKVGNRSSTVTKTFIFDTTPIRLTDSNVITNPADGAFVNGLSIPGTSESPFVEALIDATDFDPLKSKIIVRDYCRIPPSVKGVQTTTGPKNLTYTFTSPLATNGSQDGLYTIEMDIADFAGNVAPTYTTTFTYDTRTPSVSETFPTTNQTVKGPLRIVDATMSDPRVDFCRRNSGIDRSKSSLELWLTDGNENSGNTYTVPRQVPGTLRFISTGDVDRVLLELNNQSGIATGLKNDGSEDGAYQIRAQAFDQAGNQSEISNINFVYDTQIPFLNVPNISDECTFTVPTLDFEGTTQDNRGGSGINRVEVTLQSVDSNGYDTADPPIFYQKEVVLAPLGLGPFDPSPPQRSFTFSGSLSQVTSDVRAALIIRSYDEGGNFVEKRNIVKIRSTSIPAPYLSSPAHEFTTSARIIPFSWNAVSGASKYKLKIVTPNQNEVIQEVSAPKISKTLNLESYADGNGRYAWAVAASDCSGNYGPYSQNRILIVDSNRPQVMSIDVFDPSPESSGSINEGEVRFTIRFTEHMLTTKPLKVVVTPQNVNATPILVEMMSYIGDTWTGRAFIPDVVSDEPGYNGLATISVTGGYDLGNNAMLEPMEGFTIFEIDTGPYFTLALFQNPVNTEDVILVVKGQTWQDGPSERLVAPLTVLIKRSGQRDQMPEMFRMGSLSHAFRGSFFVDSAFSSDIEFQISGSDEQGNSSTRSIVLKVSHVSSSEGGIIISANKSLIISAGAGAVEKDTNIFVNSSSALLSDSLETDIARQTGGELNLLAKLGGIEPSGIRLARGFDLLADLSKLAPATDVALLEKAGLYRVDGDKYIFLPGGFSDGSLTGNMDVTGGLIVCADLVAPVFNGLDTEKGLETGAFGDPLTVKVSDFGSGIDEESILVLIDGRKVESSFDSDGSRVSFTPGSLIGRGVHSLTISVADNAGNPAVIESSLVAPPDFGFNKVDIYPNPARNFARIRYKLNVDADEVKVSIYDVSGHKVTTLYGNGSAASLQEMTWNLTDRRGRVVSNGVYMARISASGAGTTSRETVKVAVLR